MADSVDADTGPIIHLAEAEALDLLGPFDSLHLPETVRDELAAGGVPDGFDALDARIHEVEPLDRSSLDPGEAAAIALCTDLDGVLLTDDLEARAVAESEGLEVHGSIGVVLYAYGTGAISGQEASALLRALESESSLYLSKPLRAYALQVVEESEGGW